MSKKGQLEHLATFIGLRAAHEIMIKHTNMPESIPHLDHEADTYSDLSFDLAKGNWNDSDIKMIKQLAEKKCNQKLDKYKDISAEKYKVVNKIIENIMIDLELKCKTSKS